MLKRVKKFLMFVFVAVCCSCVSLCAKLYVGDAHVHAENSLNLEETYSGTNWSYNGDGGLALNGVSWNSTLTVSCDELTIYLTGENKIEVTEGWALNFSGSTLNISGTGTLELIGSPTAINGIGGPTITLTGMQAYIGESTTPVTEITADNLTAGKIKFVPVASGSQTSFGSSSEATSSPEVSWSSTSNEINYTNLNDGKYDLKKLFSYDKESYTAAFSYRTSNDANWTTMSGSELQITQVQTYQIKCEIVADGSSSSKERELVVKKADPEITIATTNETYTGQEIDLNFSLNGGLTATTSVEYYFDEARHQKLSGKPINVGTYYPKIHIEGTALTNEVTYSAYTLTILKMDVSINWSAEDFTYDGTVKTVRATYVNVDNQTVALNVTFDKPVFKDAGDYVATASFKFNELNYSLPETVTKSYSIAKIQLTININDRSHIFGESAKSLTASVDKASSGTIVSGENPYSLYTTNLEGGDISINSSTAVGAYKIKGKNESTTNYDITFNEGNYYVKNKIHTLTMQSWTYLDTEKSPSANAYAKSDEIVYTYFMLDGFGTTVELSEKPSEPGNYRVRASISDSENSYNKAISWADFQIRKIAVDAPSKDDNVYVYDGTDKVYNIQENSIYSVENQRQRNAGNYTVQVSLIDKAHYAWKNNEDKEFMEYSFEIKKKQVEKPAQVASNFKYSGKPIAYPLQASNYYRISPNSIQTEVGTYWVTISLNNPQNTEWEDSTSDDIQHKFVICQSDILNPTTIDAHGKALSTSPVVLVSSGANGIAPSVKLTVSVCSEQDINEIKAARTKLKNNLTKYDKIFVVYDVKLTDGEGVTQPNGAITLKMKIPEKLIGAKFRLLHIHVDENGVETVSELDYDGVGEDGFIAIQTDKLSEFVFVYKQDSLVLLVVVLAVLCFVLLAALALLLLLLLKKNNKKNKKAAKTTLAAAVPVFFVKSQVTASIVLGSICTALLIADVVLLVFILKRKKQKETPKSSKEAVDMASEASKPKRKIEK